MSTTFVTPKIGRGLPPGVCGLLDELDAKPRMDAAAAAELLRKLPLGPSELAPWVDFDHPLQDSYGRKLIARGPNFELMAMSWAPGDYSAIHDHGAAEWGAVKYFGEADHVIFEMRDGIVRIRERMITTYRSVCPVDSSLIHMMGNPTGAPFLSLHLYGRVDPAESITGDARVFDFWDKQIQRTDGGVFFCLPEAEIVRCEDCPGADRQTVVLHNRLMLERVKRILGTHEANRALIQKAFDLEQELRRLESARGV